MNNKINLHFKSSNKEIFLKTILILMSPIYIYIAEIKISKKIYRAFLRIHESMSMYCCN